MIKKKIYNFFYKKKASIANDLKIKFKINLNNDLQYHIKSFGNLNPKKIFYVIQRFKGGGMFSNINYILHHLFIARKLNCIPIIDFKNFPTKYNVVSKINNSHNVWDYYFKPINKYTLNEVYKSKFVIISSNKTMGIKEFDSFTNLNNEHYKIFIDNFKLLPKIKNEIDIFYKSYFNNKRVIGVHFRGSDMKTQERHPFPATEKQIINAINFQLSKKRIDKIFLVTEVQKYHDKLKNIYKDKLISYKSFRTNNYNIFESRNRNNHRYLIGKENLIDMMLLSKTKLVICSKSHLSEASKFINFKNKKFKLFEIDNGYNSKNIIIAQFLWYLKASLPKILGGFDKNYLKKRISE